MATASQFPNLNTRIPGAMIDTLFGTDAQLNAY